MVEKHGSSDRGAEWTFTLRDGLKWHDGKPVVAEDAAESIKRWAWAEFRALRAESVAPVRSLRGADLGRAGTHPQVGEPSVRDPLQEWVHHDRNRLKRALANVQARVWPHMGNARRFSRSAE